MSKQTVFTVGQHCTLADMNNITLAASAHQSLHTVLFSGDDKPSNNAEQDTLLRQAIRQTLTNSHFGAVIVRCQSYQNKQYQFVAQPGLGLATINESTFVLVKAVKQPDGTLQIFGYSNSASIPASMMQDTDQFADMCQTAHLALDSFCYKARVALAQRPAPTNGPLAGALSFTVQKQSV